MTQSLKNFHAHWLHYREQGLVSNLETIQDLIITSLCLCLFLVMLARLEELLVSLLHPLNFQTVTSEILFLLIIVELFRILIIYLKEREFSVGVALEASIVSVLREVILHGVLEIPYHQLWAVCSFLISLGILSFLRTLESVLFKK
jgi:uncharacterized membrane protein (DUF373 family)